MIILYFIFVRPLDSVIAFNENCYVLPYLDSDTNQFYSGHEKLIMVNPAQPKYIR